MLTNWLLASKKCLDALVKSTGSGPNLLRASEASEFYSPLTPQNQKNFYPSKFSYFPLSEGPETLHTGREEDYPEAFFFVCRYVAPFSRYGIFSDRCQKIRKFSNSISRNFSSCDWPQIRPVCRGWQALQNTLTSLRLPHSVLKIP